MVGPVFAHERLDVYRLAIEYVVEVYAAAASLNGVDRHIRDQWLRAAQSIPLNIAEGNGKIGIKDRNRYFQIARGSTFECAAIHDVLMAYQSADQETLTREKCQLHRIAAMLTRLIQSGENARAN